MHPRPLVLTAELRLLASVQWHWQRRADRWRPQPTLLACRTVSIALPRAYMHDIASSWQLSLPRDRILSKSDTE
jgi:hypothetical protein